MHKEHHQQQLPNEIILSIIDLFENDLAQLHRFLTVSRFFFEAAVQRLYTNPFGLLNHDQPPLTSQQRERHRTRNSALADILLGSMLLYSGQAPSHVLQWFDLSIVNPQSHPFLASCLANTNDDLDNGMEYNEAQEYRTVPTPTVVDYSDYLAVFPLDSTYLDWSSFFVVENQMILQPTRVNSNALHEKKSMTSSYVQRMILYLTAEHLCHLSIPIHQLFLLSLWGLPKRLASLKVLQVLMDRELDVNWAFGNLARFLGELKLAFPDRGPLEVFLPPQLLRVAALQPLQDPDPEITTATPEITTTCATLERQQNPFFEKSLAAYATLIAPCRLSVSWCPWFYQWVQKSHLEFNLSRLQIFKDIRDRVRLDGFNRFSREPNPIQDLALCQTFHQFLCQCPRLRRLDIFVSHVDQFDFSTAHLTPMVTRADLPRLWILTLWGDRHYQTMIGALNDAMDTFGETLKRVCVQRTRPGQDLQRRQRRRRRQPQSPSPLPGTYPPSQPPLASIALSKRCNRIGFWTMPFLCELVLQLGDVPALDVGTFSGCPQLEELTIEFGIQGWSESNQRRLDAVEHDEGLDSLSGNDPRLRTSPGLGEAVEEEEDEDEDEEMDEDEDQDFELIRDEEEFLGQAYWFQRNPHVPTWLDSRQKFPRWSLPRLRLLVLKGRAPTLFNYESFGQGLMPNLMQVQFVESSPDHYLYFAEDEDRPRIVRNVEESGVWEDVRSHFRPRARTVESVSEALEKCSISPASPLEVTTTTTTTTPDPVTSDDSNHQDMDPDEAGTTQWHLPKLQSLSLKGECVFAFHWDRLLTLPALTHLTLSLPRVTSQMFEMKNVLPTHEDNEIKEREEVVSETDLARPPFLQSQLVYLSVEGDWRFSRRELQELLMVYAPYLRGMVVRSGVGFYKMEPFVFLKTMAQIHYLVKGTRYQTMIASARDASHSADNAKNATATLSDQVLDAYWLNRLGLEGETIQDLDFEKRNAGQNLRVVHYEGRILSQDLDLLKDDYHLLQASSCSGSPASSSSSSSSSTPSTSSSSKPPDSRTKRGTAFFFSGKCVLRNQE